MLVIFLFAIDATIVSSAMPTVVANLGGLDLYSWVFSSYMLTSALSTPLFGKLSDLFSRQRLMLMGIAVFMLGSALSGAAGSIEQLILFRAVQGVGGGAIYAVSFILIAVLFPAGKLAKMQGLISGIWGMSSIFGPLAGGVITQYWSWRWIFLVNLPLCFIAIALIFLGFHEKESAHRKPRLDLKGAAILLLGLLLLFYALARSGDTSNLLDPALLGLFAFALVALFFFFVVESRAEEPIMPVGLFRLRQFRTSIALATLASMGVFGVITFLPLYVQGVLGGSASKAGISLLLASLGWSCGSLMGGPVMNRFGYRAVCIAGMALMALGYGLFVATAARAALVPALADAFFIGIGMGIANVTATVAAQTGVPREQIGVATSTFMLSRTFGGAFGVSLMGSVIARHLHADLEQLSHALSMKLSANEIERLANPQYLMAPMTRALIPENLLQSLVGALGGAIWYAFLTGLIVLLIGLGVSLFMTDFTPASTPRPGQGLGS